MIGRTPKKRFYLQPPLPHEFLAPRRPSPPAARRPFVTAPDRSIRRTFSGAAGRSGRPPCPGVRFARRDSGKPHGRNAPILRKTLAWAPRDDFRHPAKV